MPNPGQELSSIDFESMIGGPLVAVVNAQAQAAMSTVNFIKEVGFKKPASEEDAGGDTSTEEPIYVTFKYPKELSPYQPATPGNPSATPPVPATPAVPAVYETQELKVPILTILPIPFIRIDLITVDFNAKINSVEYRKTNTRLKVDSVPMGSQTQVADSNGYFTFHKDLKPPILIEIQNDVLAVWHTAGLDDGLYDIRILLKLAGAPGGGDVPPGHVSSIYVKAMLDNTKPAAAVALDLGPCTKYKIGDTIYGKFTVNDPHISNFSLVVTSSVPNPPTISPASGSYPTTLPVPGLTDQPFTLTTDKNTTPCGYVIRLNVWDRTIRNNSRPGNYNYDDVGLCLLKGK